MVRKRGFHDHQHLCLTASERGVPLTEAMGVAIAILLLACRAWLAIFLLLFTAHVLLDAILACTVDYDGIDIFAQLGPALLGAKGL